MPKQGLIHRSVDEVGNVVLTLLYGAKEIVFDDFSFFGFAQGLIRQSHFTGNEAVSWAAGKTWPEPQYRVLHIEPVETANLGL